MVVRDLDMVEIVIATVAAVVFVVDLGQRLAYDVVNFAYHRDLDEYLWTRYLV